MPLQSGTTLGPYEILSPLGAGGMGEVYKARDTRLDRTVAIKVLPEHVASDPDLKQRFEREAKTISSLNHPHICTLHDIGSQDGIDFLVMEYLEGDTLAQRLEKGALPLDQALQVAIEIADALDKAHRQGITHRDLKPGNIMLTKAGAKLLDFGLAKLKPGHDAPVGVSAATVSAGLTSEGAILGTLQYMAPEQLEGKEADARTDIFAFGILLYEMLAGVHPFQRISQSGTIAAILRDTPAPVSQYAKDAPDTARVTLDRLLAKEPQHRYQSFRDVRADLRHLLQDGSGLTPASQPTPAATTSTVGRTPFVGRESERAEAHRLLDQAVVGQGSLLLLGGEPGIGKTRFAEEVLAEAQQRGCLALTGRCYETGGTPPFIPWVEMVERSASIVPRAAFREALGDAAPEVAKLVPELRRTFPDIPQPIELPPDQQRRYLFNSFLEFLSRGSRGTPQALLIDDLQWADESTLLLLQHIAPQLSQIPLLILGTYRDVDLDVERPFAEMLETLTRQRLAHKLALGRLNERSVAEMLKALSNQAPPPALVTAVYAETEGNPFFTEEVFHHLAEEGRILDEHGEWRNDLRVEDLEVPEGVRLVIGRRLKRLSDDARSVLAGAAIVGRSFDIGLLEALGDAKGAALETALEEAESAKLILTMSSGRELRWEFAHGLIRQTLEHGLSLMRRQRTHLRVAEAMERVYGAHVERFASDIAQHLYQAGVAADPEKTVRYLTLAGDQALAKGAFDEALRQFENAISVQDEDEQRQIADLLYRKGRALRSLGSWEEAIEEWTQALSINEALGDSATMAALCWDMAYLLLWMARTTEAVRVVQRVLDVLGSEPSVDRSRLLARGGWALGLGAKGSDDVVAGDAMLSESIAMAEALGDLRAHREALVADAYKHFLALRSPELADVSQRAAERLRSAGDLWQMADTLTLFQLGSVFRGRLDGVAEFEGETEPLVQRLGHHGAEIFAVWAHGLRDWMVTADLDQLELSAQRLLEVSARAGMPWGSIYECWLVLASVWRGRLAEARDRAQHAAGQEPLIGAVTGQSWSCLFLCECLLDQRETALALLQARRSGLPRTGRPNTAGAWMMLLRVIEGLAVLREQEAAAELHPLALEAIETGTVTGWDAHRLWQTVAGIAAAAGGQWEQAETHYQTALSQAHEIPFRSEQPEVRRWYARMLLDRNIPGDRDKARTLIGEATEMYQTIGMPKHLEMVEAMSAEL